MKSIKYYYLKYINQIIYISVYCLTFFLFNLIPGGESDAKIVLLPILSLCGLAIFFLIHLVCISDYKDRMPLEFTFRKKSYFDYKGRTFFTTNENLHSVYLFEPKIFKYVEITSLTNTENINEYQNNLKRELDSYISKDINKKLSKRRSKFKFKEFNQIK